MTQSIPVPFFPRKGLRVGQQWRQSEALPILHPAMLTVIYSVVGEAKVDGRTCLKVEKRVEKPLPLKVERPSLPTHELTYFVQDLWVEPATGHVLRTLTHLRMRSRLADLQGTAEQRLEVSLQQTRQLSSAELASRIKEAAEIERAQRAADPEAPPAPIK